MERQIKVFIEYKVMSEHLIEYKELIQQLKEFYSQEYGFQVYEGADQPGLFVEEFYVVDMDEYAHMKQERLNGSSSLFTKIRNCIEGGSKKLNIWAFVKI